MKQVLILLSFVVLFSITSCKSKSDKKTDKIESISDLKDYAENAEQKSKEASKKVEERRARGDTLAMPYKDLQAYLPQIEGYTNSGGPKGSQMNTPGLGSWSQTEQEYQSGDKRVTASIFDYNSAQQALVGMTAVYAMGFSSEDDTKKQAPLDLGIKDVSAYETIYKTEKRAELAIVVADRFIINLKSEGNNDEEFLKSVAKSMKLEELAKK